MEKRNIFKNISPIDHRYYLSNKEVFDKLALYISEEASIDYCLKVEIALLKTHLQFQGLLTANAEQLLYELPSKVTADEVYEEEEKTQHNIRALVNVMKSYLPEEWMPYVHLGATSVDILDTASALRNRDAIKKVILPLLIEVEEILIDISETEAETPQVGRTHGQHAVPITFGFAMAEYVSRLGKSIESIDKLTDDFKGKLAGAVGSYNSTSMIVPDPLQFEKDFLMLLNLEPSEHSTQMVEPEYQLRVLLEINIAFGIIANLVDDLRHLQRSEINEIRELFTATQVGSSTMPQKRNPWNSEHVKSLWKTFAPRVMTFFMDQISEHQRDLSNSASARFVADYLAGFTAAVQRLKKILSTLYVNRDQLKTNMTHTGDLVLAEAAYILLAVTGEKDAHEVIRKITLACENNKTRLIDEIKKYPDVLKRIDDQLSKTVKISAETFFSDPASYNGQSSRKAREIAAAYRKKMQTLKEHA